MRKFITIILSITIGVLVFQIFGYRIVKPPPAYSDLVKKEANASYKRIISLLPSTTEILFALSLGDQVVGVTRYCKFPPEAQKKINVGGLLDPNFEIIYNLKPDLLVLATSDNEQKMKLKKMGFPILEVETRSIPGIIESIDQMGTVFDRQEKAKEITKTIRNKIESIQEKTKSLPKPRVLITYLRPFGEGDIREVYIAGNRTFFNDLIEICGGVNAYQGNKLITSPVLSAEGILELNPDIIIEVMNQLQGTNFTVEDVRRDWDALPQTTAYKNNAIYIMVQPYIDIPGPRLAQVVDDLARIIHPEVNWNKSNE